MQHAGSKAKYCEGALMTKENKCGVELKLNESSSCGNNKQKYFHASKCLEIKVSKIYSDRKTS